ncbi:kunitz-type serine protease inhibitor PIVL [Anoplopoma fimbria]|uniref:kunitz-type serine protease inhibitor PIVL n=1 Tax=Anoplopoma fimbria TaxID=229290 RepID=UPI0023EC6661|nr:kunitz-type serine protease inhibitor PIVL [Anoplopoma fimbria]
MLHNHWLIYQLCGSQLIRFNPTVLLMQNEVNTANKVLVTNSLEGVTAEWGKRKKRVVFGTNAAAADRCLEPMSEGACSEYVLLWYFHPRSGECRPFVYGGCGGNGNQFPSRQECQSWCRMERRGTEPWRGN